MIAHNKPYFDSEDEVALLQCLRSSYIAEGEKVKSFEVDLSKYIGLPYTSVISNGTTALYLSLYTLGIQEGDEVIIPTYTCSALLNAIYMHMATPVLVDINLEDFNIKWDDVDTRITNRTRAIIVPHAHGMPSYIPRLSYRGIPIVEDCAIAIGSKVLQNGQFVSVGHNGILSCFSFYASKFLSVGYCGCISTQVKELYDKIVNYREFDCQESYYPRFNFQVSDLIAALGISQLRKIDKFKRRRCEISQCYDEIFSAKGITKQTIRIHGKYNNYRYVVTLPKKERDKLQNHLKKKQINSIIPIENYELLHNYLRLEKDLFINAEKVADTTLSIPLYPALKDKEVNYIVDSIKTF